MRFSIHQVYRWVIHSFQEPDFLKAPLLDLLSMLVYDMSNENTINP